MSGSGADSESDLRGFLADKYVSTTDWNITGMGGGWTGKMKIPDEAYDKFLSLIYKHIFIHNKTCTLLEKHKPNSPILIDLDFRYAGGGALMRKFTEDQIREFVAAYADAIARFIGPLVTENAEGEEVPMPLQFFVMVKPGPESVKDKDYHKDGVHIVCPTLTTTPEIQYALRGYLLQTRAIERIFGSTGIINDAQDVLDLSVISRNNWFLYGACKPDKCRYDVTAVYAFTVPEDARGPDDAVTADELEELPLSWWSPRKLVKLLSIRRGHDEPTVLALREGAAEVEWAQLVERWGKGSNWATKPPKRSVGVGAGEPARSKADDMIQISGHSVRSGNTSKDIEFAFKLVDRCLDPEARCGEYHDWIRTAICLKNISDTNDSFLAWVDLTRRTDPGHKKSTMTDDQLRAKWRLTPTGDGEKGTLSMSSLRNWARRDNYAVYKELEDLAFRELAMVNDSGTHVSIAEQACGMYKHEFRCVPPKKGASVAMMDWYQFPSDGHTWKSLKSNMRVRERLSNDIRNVYIKADIDIAQLSLNAQSEGEKERLNKKREKLLKIETNLETTGFKESVMKEISEKFYTEDFLSRLNQTTDLVGFRNGILELRNKHADGTYHIHFRPGNPGDCISFQMGRGIVGLSEFDYMPYDPDHPEPEHLEILEFFLKIYPEKDVREYCLTLYAACLEGNNKEQKFYIMVGKGGNGKSKIIELNSKTFGEYQDTLPATTITRKRADGGSANPELICIKNKRYISITEPEAEEKINASLMKQFSGDDVVKARGLFQDQDQFIVTARIFMSVNDMPPIHAMDGGTWRRLMVIPHISTFVEAGKPTDPDAHIYPRDNDLETKIPHWRPYYAGILAWYFENRYLRTGLIPPAQVTRASDEYKAENDAFSGFVDEHLVREVGGEAAKCAIWKRYTDWLKYNPAKKKLTRTVVYQKMQDMFGAPIDDKKYAGVRLGEEGVDAV